MNKEKEISELMDRLLRVLEFKGDRQKVDFIKIFNKLTTEELDLICNVMEFSVENVIRFTIKNLRKSLEELEKGVEKEEDGRS